MSKGSGGSRNYRGTRTFDKRKSEYDSLMSSGDYDASRSYMDESGGFVATNIYHKEVTDHDIDKSDVAAIDLAKKGYKIYLDDERSYISGVSTPDGRVYDMRVDIKTINSAGKYTIKSAVEKAVSQVLNYERNHGIDPDSSKHAVVLKQNCKGMTKKYVLSQLQKIREESTSEIRKYLDLVIVVGMSDKRNVHRHFMKK